MESNPEVRTAFVSTNSITQGEQVGVLWPSLQQRGVKINFAHRTFQWSSEAPGSAAVHCVIVGMTMNEDSEKWIFEYENVKAEPHAVRATNINPYLVDGPNIALNNRTDPICPVPSIAIGNKPIDGGNYLFSVEERDAFIQKEPAARKYFKRWIGSDEFINGYERWCLWVGDVEPSALRAMPLVLERVERVREFRLASKSAPTRAIAKTPTRFHVENMPQSEFVLVPKVSSEKRAYIPMGFMTPDTLVSDLVFIIEGATRFHLGILSSEMHMAWVRAVCGRLESRYRYSAGIVYNNFPWPDATSKQQQAIEDAAQLVLDVRTKFSKSTLADLYDPVSMPPELSRAHRALDRAVDSAYGKKDFKSEAERVAYLFDVYQNITAPLDRRAAVPKSRSARKKS